MGEEAVEDGCGRSGQFGLHGGGAAELVQGAREVHERERHARAQRQRTIALWRPDPRVVSRQHRRGGVGVERTELDQLAGPRRPRRRWGEAVGRGVALADEEADPGPCSRHAKRSASSEGGSSHCASSRTTRVGRARPAARMSAATAMRTASRSAAGTSRNASAPANASACGRGIDVRVRGRPRSGGRGRPAGEGDVELGLGSRDGQHRHAEGRRVAARRLDQRRLPDPSRTAQDHCIGRAAADAVDERAEARQLCVPSHEHATRMMALAVVGRQALADAACPPDQGVPRVHPGAASSACSHVRASAITVAPPRCRRSSLAVVAAAAIAAGAMGSLPGPSVHAAERPRASVQVPATVVRGNARTVGPSHRLVGALDGDATHRVTADHRRADPFVQALADPRGTGPAALRGPLARHPHPGPCRPDHQRAHRRPEGARGPRPLVVFSHGRGANLNGHTSYSEWRRPMPAPATWSRASGTRRRCPVGPRTTAPQLRIPADECEPSDFGLDTPTARRCPRCSTSGRRT